MIYLDALHRFDLEASSYVNKEVNVFNRKLNKIIKLYVRTSQLHLNMQREHFITLGMHMNGSGKDRTSGLLTSRIMELLIIHRLGTPITLPWEAETVEEEEKQMEPTVKESNFTSSELIVTDEQGKHSTSVKQGGVKVQNIGFVPVNNAEHCTLGEMSNSSDKLCNDSDISKSTIAANSRSYADY